MRDARDELDSSLFESVLKARLGDALFSAVERPLTECGEWGERRPTSCAHFKMVFGRRAENARAHPLLAAFLAVEETLPIIRTLPAVLRWQATLEQALSGGERLSRAQAGALSNTRAIALLPEARRPAAEAELAAFCEAFNQGLPQVQLIYQCTANPFRAQNGGIDLGDGARMDRDTPVAFSLPSLLPDAASQVTQQLLVPAQLLLVPAERLLADSCPTPRRRTRAASAPSP